MQFNWFVAGCAKMLRGGKMHSTHDRPNTHMRNTIDTIISQLDDVGRHQAANEMLAWGVPLPVIARVLYEPDRRRPVTHP